MFALYFWTIVAMESTYHPSYDWRYMGEFRTVELCKEAARQLSKEPKVYRCIMNK